MSTALPFSVVLRLSGIELSKADLESRLKAGVERYSPDKGGYAQLSVEEEKPDWKIIDAFLERLGPAVSGLCISGVVRSACLDLAFGFSEGLALASYTLPSRTAALAGSCCINVMFSICLTS